MSESLEKRLEALEAAAPEHDVWMEAICDDGTVERLPDEYGQDLVGYIYSHGYHTPTGKHFHDVTFSEWEGETDELSESILEWQIEAATAEGTDKDPRKMLEDLKSGPIE